MKIVSFAGLSKNAGKTTALLSCLRAWRSAQHRIGLLSIGLDGERRDTIFGTSKPSVFVAEGDLFVTTRDVAQTSALARPISTIRGARGWCVYEATMSGSVVLTGIRDRGEMELALGILSDAGAARVAIDGAFDRWSHLAPRLADECVLAVGLGSAPSVDLVVRRTRELVNHLGLPVGEGFDVPIITAATLNRGSAKSPLALRVPDATCVFVSAALCESLGVTVRVQRPIRLSLVTCNPTSPSGLLIDATVLVRNLAIALPDALPIVDVVAGISSHPHINNPWSAIA